MIDIASLTPDELNNYIVNELKEKSFRADQIFRWLHIDKVSSFDEMTNLSKGLREMLKDKAFITIPKPLKVLTSNRDGTVKYLFELSDLSTIEAVLMKYDYGYSLCISSQVGCRMNCSFCATGKGGFVRNLTAAEMLSQIYYIERSSDIIISRVVVMGMGEPLDNYDNLVRFIRLLCDERGRNLSRRHITVSTCGIVPGILKLSELGLQITLAISLHSAIDEKRSEIMPVNRAYPLDMLLDAAVTYFQRTGRRVSFEYSLIKGVNDSEIDREALIKAAKRVGAHVNLIPVNPVEEVADYVPPDMAYVRTFQNVLEKSGINVTIRREMGRDIKGACGQLRMAQNPDNTLYS